MSLQAGSSSIQPPGLAPQDHVCLIQLWAKLGLKARAGESLRTRVSIAILELFQKALSWLYRLELSRSKPLAN